jgi:hypothetical protein
MNALACSRRMRESAKVSWKELFRLNVRGAASLEAAAETLRASSLD